ncbi:putative replication initiation protein [Eel River basin pequenovirus]|nr:putative replication initiation protein [Eel River basin pequenovirus]
MQFYCTSPIKRKHEVLGGYYYVRCGQCARCVVRRKAIWTGRALCEWNSNGPDGAFCTLTYDDDHVDAASYEDVKLFLKLIRLVYPLRFLAVPDTGDQFGRFHWHLLLFGPQVTPILQDFVQEKWRCGLTDTRPINYERIGYTCGYVTKKIAGETVGRLRSSQFFGRDQLLAICAEYAATFGPITDYPTVLKLGKKRFPIGPTQRKYIADAFGLQPNSRPTWDYSVEGHVQNYRTLSLHGAIREEKQLLSKRGTTIGSTSRTEIRMKELP